MPQIRQMIVYPPRRDMHGQPAPQQCPMPPRAEVGKS
jgi:hypothetical protein